jgi:hypothetical protein
VRVLDRDNWYLFSEGTSTRSQLYTALSEATPVSDIADLGVRCEPWPPDWQLKRSGDDVLLDFGGAEPVLVATSVGSETEINQKLMGLSTFLNSKQLKFSLNLCTYNTVTLDGLKPDGIGHRSSYDIKDVHGHLVYFELKKLNLDKAAKGI